MQCFLRSVWGTSSFMKLKELEQQRDAYAGRIAKLAIQIALIFGVPAALAIGLSRWFEVKIMYLLPVAFIISWIMVITLYRKVDRKVRELEQQISELKKEELEKGTKES